MKKIISGAAITLCSLCSFAQNADFAIVPQNLNPVIHLGDTAIVQITILNNGSTPLRVNSVMASSSAPGNGRYVGLAPGSDTLWSLQFLGTGASANSIRLINTGGALDAGPNPGSYTNVNVYLVGVQVSNVNVFTANVGFNPFNGGDSLASYSAQGNAQTGNDNNTTSLTVQVPLPLDFLDINAAWNHSDAAVSWSVANEVNNNYFSVERSFDGKNFKEIGQVKSIGNHADEHAYSYLDAGVKDQVSGKVFYRVKQIDINRKYTWSDVVNLAADKVKNEAYIFPNPAMGDYFSFVYENFNIAETVVLDIQLMDVHGRVLRQLKENITKGKNQFQIPIDGIASGTYYLNYSNETYKVKGSIRLAKQ
jgi:hypothetical protein